MFYIGSQEGLIQYIARLIGCTRSQAFDLTSYLDEYDYIEREGGTYNVYGDVNADKLREFLAFI